jgi:hypothetical protein
METLGQQGSKACESDININISIHFTAQVESSCTTMAKKGIIIVIILWQTEPEQSPYYQHQVTRNLSLESPSELLQCSLRNHLSVLDDVEATTNEGSA